MEERKYLNEENYQRSKKKITRISLIIFLIAVIIGGILIAMGIIKTKEVAKINEERYAAAYKLSQEQLAADKQRLNEIASEMETLNSEYNAKEQECNSLKMGDNDWFAKHAQCQRESSTIQSKIAKLKIEKFKLENANYTVNYDELFASKYIPLIFVGGLIIFIGSLISFYVYIFTKRREIAAFTIQQTMPVTKEGIDEMAPTIGKAAGEIVKGIKKGLDDENR